MPRHAAIDIGTNTVRLLVADVDEGGLDVTQRRQEITRLGQGVDERRVLSAEAIARTAGAVERFAMEASSSGAREIRIAGTSALRDARNSFEFAQAVEASTGRSLEILEGEDEGRLAFLGSTSGLEGGPFLVCDIGGGSTEFVRGHRWMEMVWSADVGSVRLRERYLSSDPPTAGEVAGALTAIASELLQVERDVGLVGDETVVGVAGTVTTMAALTLGLESYDPERVHGSRIPADEIRRLARKLLSMTTDEVGRLPCVAPGRADVLAAGALILREVVDRWGFSDVLVSERDILDGLLLDLVLGPEAGLPPMVDPTA